MSIWIAKFLGPVFIVAAIPMMTSPRIIGQIGDDFLKSRALMYVTGILALAGGLAIVNTHNTWVMNWPVVITVFGWAMIVSGASRVAAPGAVIKVSRRIIERPVATRISGAVWAALGVLLSYKAYF